jgi:DNA-directed RNA polymerase subunit E'/Rpb7
MMDVEVNKNFVQAEFVDKVKVHPKNLDQNIEQNVLKVLKQTREAICTNHGYIKKNSIKIIKLDNGSIDVASFHGYIIFRVRYEALVCNPVKDNIVTARIVTVNNFGILCHSSMIEDGEEIPILEIIVPKHSLSIQSEIDLSDADNIKPGNIVMVKIVGKKYQLNNKKISIIGTIVNSGYTDVRLEKETTGGTTFDEFDIEDDAISLDNGEDDDIEGDDDESIEDDDNEIAPEEQDEEDIDSGLDDISDDEETESNIESEIEDD